MAPLGISLVNLLIESSSLSCPSVGRESKKEEKFAQNCSAVSSGESLPSPSSTTTSLIFAAGEGTSRRSSGSSSSPPFSKTASTSHIEGEANLNNNNNYFSGASTNGDLKERKGSSIKNNFATAEPSSSATQKLYSAFWEKFKKPYDQEKVDSRAHSFAGHDTDVEQGEKKKNKGEDFINNTEPTKVFDDKIDSSSSSAYKKFYDGAHKINRQLLPVWSLLSYPSDLHFYGRAAVMTVVTGLVIEKTLEKLPDIEQLEKRYGPYLQCNVLDGTDPNQPGRVGFDKDFF